MNLTEKLNHVAESTMLYDKVFNFVNFLNFICNNTIINIAEHSQFI